jgi:hypothetical protein
MVATAGLKVRHPITGHEGPSGKRGKALHFLSPRLYVGVDGRFSPRESDPVPIIQEAGWAPGAV